MQFADAILQARECFGCRAGFNIKRIHFPPIGKMNQAAAKDDLLAEETPPKIRKIHGVKGFPVVKPDRPEGGVAQRFGGHGDRETGLRALLPAGQFKGKGIRGKQNLAGAQNSEGRMQQKWSLEIAAFDVDVLEKKNSGALRGCGQPGQDLSGIDCATGDFVHGAKLAGVAPMNWRTPEVSGAAKFVHAWQMYVAIDAQGAEDFLVSG